jgi:uncharacterized protein
VSEPIRIHLIVGAPTHDTNYARLELLKLIHENERAQVTVGSDFSDCGAIAASDAVIAYTCNLSPGDAELDALEAFMQRGGRLFALHATNALLRFTDGPVIRAQGIEIPGRVDTSVSNPRFTNLLGSRFLSHLLLGPMHVEVAAPQHPIVAGLEPFDVIDEPYIVELTGACEVLLTASFSGINDAYVLGDWSEKKPRPQMYLKSHGRGEVLYLNLGHCCGRYDLRPLMAQAPQTRGPWENESFRTLLRRSLAWVMAE